MVVVPKIMGKPGRNSPLTSGLRRQVKPVRIGSPNNPGPFQYSRVGQLVILNDVIEDAYFPIMRIFRARNIVGDSAKLLRFFKEEANGDTTKGHGCFSFGMQKIDGDWKAVTTQ
jgi:hypothetical protein